MRIFERQNAPKVSERASFICKWGGIYSPHSQSLTKRHEGLLGRPVHSLMVRSVHCFLLLLFHSRHNSTAQHSRLAALSTVADLTKSFVRRHSFFFCEEDQKERNSKQNKTKENEHGRLHYITYCEHSLTDTDTMYVCMYVWWKHLLQMNNTLYFLNIFNRILTDHLSRVE